MQWDERSQNYIEDDRSRLNVLPSKLVKHAHFFYYWNHYNTLQDCHFLAPTPLFICYIQFLFEPNASSERRMRIFLFKTVLKSVYRWGLLKLDVNQSYLTSAINFPRNDLRLGSVSVCDPAEKRGKRPWNPKGSSQTRHDAVSCWC